MVTDMKKTIAAAALAAASWAHAGRLTLPAELDVSADRIAADNRSGTLVATGNVQAVAAPLRLWSDCAEKRGWDYGFAPGTKVTTCTNDECALHWSVSGEVAYHGREGERYATVKNASLRLFGLPVAWFPYWYYPFDTDYGWRVTPGYTSRWGAYLLTKCVYPIAGSTDPESWRLSGSTRFDLRTENGVALGQGLYWRLGELGQGRFKVYYAWDEDADRYDRHWNKRSWHYSNWGSKVPDERYALMLSHRWDATERDSVRIAGSYLSDTHFRSDFLRDGMFGHSNRYLGHDGNEIAWEHLETLVGFGAVVSGPLNEFYGGVSRLPEAYLNVMPQPVFSLPVNYESATRIGWLNRDYAKLGRETTSTPFRYNPGRWADYQAFRFDTYHRLTAPFRVADVVSVVPRFGFRGTYWSDTGRTVLDGSQRADATGDGAWRTVVEGGVTFAARGVARMAGGWSHVLEPYFDVLAQEAEYHGLSRGGRPLVFDAVEGSGDWLDQFAGRSRNLPYSWYGFTPGLRNAFRAADAKGRERTFLDLDVYAAVQLNDTDWTEGGRWHRLVRKPSDPHYGKRSGETVPGVRARWSPADGTALSARVEYDTENSTVAYADVSWRQELSDRFKFDVTFSGRDHRWWDYSSTPYDPETMKNDDFNRARFDYLRVGCEHDFCDALAWGPYVSWDCREGELDEIGAWFDVRTDCLGFRFSVSYENDYVRIDRSRADDDWRFGFFIYLRAFGPSSGTRF